MRGRDAGKGWGEEGVHQTRDPSVSREVGEEEGEQGGGEEMNAQRLSLLATVYVVAAPELRYGC